MSLPFDESKAVFDVDAIETMNNVEPLLFWSEFATWTLLGRRDKSVAVGAADVGLVTEDALARSESGHILFEHFHVVLCARMSATVPDQSALVVANRLDLKHQAHSKKISINLLL